MRALVVDAEGVVRGRVGRPLRTKFPAPGWVEQDPDEMWTESLSVLRSALAESGLDVEHIAGIGVVSQRATALAWDRESGRALAPAIGWQDRRTAARAAELRAQGIPIDTLPSATKFEWWLQNEPAVADAAREGRLRLGTPEAWLGAKLSGGASCTTDPGCASATGLAHPRRPEWSAPAAALFGLDPNCFPEIVATSAVVAETPKALFGKALPIAARAGDQQAAAFAQGVHREGEAKLTLGTSAMLDLHTGDAPRRPGPASGAVALPLWSWPDGRREFCLEANVVTAGATIDWLVSLGILARAGDLDRVASPSSDGVIFVPALQGLGTPYARAEARGWLGGLTRGSARGEIACAALEGIAQRCVDCCESLGLGDEPLRCDGGLARSRRLVQSLADLRGAELCRSAETENTALGAAFLAGIAVGLFAGPESIRGLRAPPERFLPRLGQAEREASRERWGRAIERTLEEGE